jgi:hypothetical protein
LRLSLNSNVSLSPRCGERVGLRGSTKKNLKYFSTVITPHPLPSPLIEKGRRGIWGKNIIAAQSRRGEGAGGGGYL